MDQDRRRFSRVPIDFPIELTLMDGSRVDGKVINLSLKGILVQTQTSLPCGESISFRISIVPDSTEFEICGKAQIVRHEGDLVGFCLIQTDVNSLSQLRRVIELNLGDSEIVEKEMADW